MNGAKSKQQLLLLADKNSHFFNYFPLCSNLQLPETCNVASIVNVCVVSYCTQIDRSYLAFACTI